MRSWSASVAPFADEQALGLDAEGDRDEDQQRADHQGADRVEHGIVRDRGQADAEEREDETGESGDVLEQHDGQLGRLRVAHERDPRLALRAHVVALFHGRAQRERLEADRDDEHRDRDPDVLELVRVGELVDALVDREQAADREQDDRDDERVDVALAAVAERVLLVGCAPRPATAEQQQQLVARVGDRVDRLGEHRGRARDEPRDELRQRDAHVREERRDDRLVAARCTHGEKPRPAARSSVR